MDAINISLPLEIVEEITRRVTEALAASLDLRRTPELLTTAQAAEYLNCKPQRIYDLKSRGDLPAFKEGGRVLIRRADLDALLVEV